MVTNNLPAFNYFQLPVEAPVKILGLQYAKCFTCVKFLQCKAIFGEKEYIRTHFKDLYPDIAQKLAEKAFSLGETEVNPIWLEQEYKKVLDVVFDRDCTYEVEGTHTIVSHIAKDYDISKGKNYLLLRELLTIYLTNFRLDVDIVENSIFSTFVTRSGDTIRVPHTGLKSKLEFSKLMLEYIKQLEAFSKDTVQFKIEGEFTMKQMLDKIIDLNKDDVMIVDGKKKN